MTTRYVFADVEIDLDRFELRRSGAVVHVEPQVFDVIVHLLRNRQRVVPKTELLDSVWGDRFVSESALTSRMLAARRAVGDDGTTQRVIRTVHGRGYQFVAPVDAEPPVVAPAEPGASGPLRQQIRFCTSEDGVRIAYAVVGEGRPLVKAANWMTHLDFDWQSEVWRHWLEGLAHGRQLVRYDDRGCGLSDWDVDDLGFDAWVDDLELVVDAMHLERFPLLGVSQGAAVAIAYAVRHPERVSRLILAGSYARGRLVRATGELQRREAALDIELARVGWGRDDATFRQVFTSQFLPDGTPEEWRAFDELQRRTISADNAVRFLEAFARIDVSGIAAQVSCPTLIVHSRNELRVPLTFAREVAALIPDSRFVPLDSRNHILTRDEPAWPVFLGEVERFLAEDD
jgi:pimeloyl-ACP methyl ester carboxylesterase/DNA-binding winged helix-turn-helix (wHTH) protein